MTRLLSLLALGAALLGGAAAPPATAQQVSDFTVSREADGSFRFRTSAAEFRLLSSGELRGALRQGERQLSLQEPGAADSVEVAGSPAAGLALDLGAAEVSDVHGALGDGKRVTARGRTSGRPRLEVQLVVEVWSEFPGVATRSLRYRNAGTGEVTLERVVGPATRLSAAAAEPARHPFEMWSFHGASVDWGQDEAVPLAPGFSRLNRLGEQLPNGSGGGVPVVAFWTRSAGLAIGHLEPRPLVASLPVAVGHDGHVSASLVVEPHRPLAPGAEYQAPRSFLAVFSGDFYAPLRLYSQLRQREGWPVPRPSAEAYAPAWCGWGYESDVTREQMLGTIPKLKEMGIHWATLDDRWFEGYGDWLPRSDTFPGDTLRAMVDAFHREGIKVQLWWLPLAVEDGRGKYEGHAYGTSRVAAEHPEWLIQDQRGGHARLTRNLAGLCPALPEVQAFTHTLVERFVRDWDFDGHKLDNVFTVPRCYNPAHHHRSPEDSIDALGEVYRTIFETTRALKPDSVTQICPCGSTPNPAWLPYMDQAVTADPVGGRQVRLRIKMYKALLGPEAAVYGDHVELSEMKRQAGEGWIEIGRDFASTVGTGGVVGTKFTWPDYGPRFKAVYLDETKEAHWKKWLSLYDRLRLSRGSFRDLYVYGYDVPEAYAIESEGVMHYAFYAPDPAVPWKGRLELRGLKAGRYTVRDSVEGTELGVVEAANPFLETTVAPHLLLEAVPVAGR